MELMRTILSILVSGTCLFSLSCRTISASDPKIVGGKDVVDPSDPAIQSTVSIMYRSNQGHLRHLCTGTVIDAYHVISAAHCYTNGPIEFMIGSGTDPREGQHYKVTQFLIPNAYLGGWESSYDIAVFTVDRPLTPELKPVAISRDKSIPDDAQFLLAGYGHSTVEGSDENFPSFGKLRKIDAGISVNKDSNEGTIKYKFNLKTSGVSESGTFRGDSGGPAYRIFDEGLQLQGSLSGGTMSTSNGRTDFNSSYTNLANFHNWLDCASRSTELPIAGLNPDSNEADQYPCQAQDKFLPMEQFVPFHQRLCQLEPGFALHVESSIMLPNGDSFAGTSCDPITRDACNTTPGQWDESAQRCVLSE